MNLKEIEARLSAIRAELENPDADLEALENETRGLIDQKRALEQKAEKRQQLINDVMQHGRTVQRFANPGVREQKDGYGVDSEEYRTAWLKNLQGKPLSAEERAAVAASAAIPTETMNRIIATMDETPMIAAVDTTYIPGNVSWPIEGSVADASWVPMATSATDSADTLSSISLSAFKLIKTLEITADVQAMAIPAFEAWLVERLANKLAATVDASIFKGTGSGQATGLLNAGELDAAGTWTADGMTYTDLMSIVAALPTKYHAGATIVTTRKVFYTEILGMTTTGGDKIVVADAQSPAKFNVLGYPVIVDDNCDADTVLFGNFKEAYKFNFASTPTVENDKSVGFRSGSTVYRVMALADGKPADTSAVVKFTKKS